MPPKRPRTDKSSGKSSGKTTGKSSGKPPGKPASSRSRSGKPPRRGKTPFGWRLYLVLAILTLLLGGLIWLAKRAEQPATRPIPPPPAAIAVDPLPAAREQVEAFLAGSGIPAEMIVREPPGAPRDYRIRHRAPKAGPVEKLRQKLRQLAPPLEVGTPEDGVLTIVDGAGKILLNIQFLPTLPPPAGKPAAPGKGGRVSIIMDDLGRALPQVRKLLAITQPVTLAILPGEPYATTAANEAHAAGREVMLHAPMEPQGYPVVDPGDDALLLSQGGEALRASMLALLARVPHAAGVNNHMGSRFTEDEQGMRVIMQVIKERDLFFVDSLTSSHSVGVDVAMGAGVPVLRRDLFLDNVAEVGAIVREIKRLAEKARQNGSAVGICHPYPETFAALQQELPRLAREGIEFVRVGDLVREGAVTKRP